MTPTKPARPVVTKAAMRDLRQFRELLVRCEPALLEAARLNGTHKALSAAIADVDGAALNLMSMAKVEDGR